MDPTAGPLNRGHSDWTVFLETFHHIPLTGLPQETNIEESAMKRAFVS